MAVDYGQMGFRMRRAMLHQLAEQAGIAIPSRETTQKVLSCFRVTIGPDGVTLAATDLQRTVFAGTAAVQRDGDGTVFLPAKRLRAILAEAPEGDVAVSVSGKTAVVAAGGTTWALDLPPAAGYGELIDPDAVSLVPAGREVLLSALKTVRHAVCRDSGRPAYTQVLIAGEAGAMYAWGTDSSQHARAPVPGFPFATRIPAAMLDDLIKLLGSVQAGEVAAGDDGRSVLFRVGPVVLSCLRMGKEFPDMGKLMMAPTAGNDAELIADKAELAAAVRRVAINASTRTSALALIADGGTLTVQARDDGGNKAEEAVAVKWGGPRRLIVINWHHLMAMLAAHPGASCVFRLGAGQGKVLPPVRLDDPETGVIAVAPQMTPVAMGYLQEKRCSAVRSSGTTLTRGSASSPPTTGETTCSCTSRSWLPVRMRRS
jgi:DNA polymerase III subunit beta